MLGRRAYDLTDDRELLIRIDERTQAIREAQVRETTRVDALFARVDALEEMHDREDGATAERRRWIGIVKAGKGMVPAGGVAVAAAAVFHWVVGQTK
jgi:hypothetical protein